ncbi:phage integrase [Enterobacter sp. PTB]|uniref:phage integrase n=1 Tax=Enterobacter sp. PTB TaxID=3143437 RepID=UPI003DA8D03D
MAIKKLDDGRYRVDIRPNGVAGKRVRKAFNTKAEAQGFERYALVNYHSKEWLNRPADKRALEELIDLWWVYFGRNERYGEDMKARLKKVCREMRNPRVSHITSKSLTEYRSEKLHAGLKASSINRDLFALSSMFTALIDAEVFSNENPVRALRKLKVCTPEMAFLSDEEISSLIAVLTGDLLNLAILCLSTGLRWGEASELRAEQIMGERVVLSQTKNGKGRTIPISPEIRERVKTKRTGRLFRVDYREFRQILKTLKPDLPKGQATHVLRHTFASHFMMNGGNIVTLQKILGHSTIQQTMVYAHFSPDYLQEATKFNPLNENKFLFQQ